MDSRDPEQLRLVAQENVGSAEREIAGRNDSTDTDPIAPVVVDAGTIPVAEPLTAAPIAPIAEAATSTLIPIAPPHVEAGDGPAIHDFEVPRFWLAGDRILMVILTTGNMIAAIIGVIVMQSILSIMAGTAPRFNSAYLAAWVAGGMGLAFLVMHLQRRKAKNVAKQLATDASIQEGARLLASAKALRPTLSERHVFNDLAKELALRGKTGAVYRVHFPGGRDGAVPIVDPFEPRLLNETDPTFSELYNAIGAGDHFHRGTAEDDGIAGDRRLGKSVKRNMALQGGILSRLFMLLLFIKEAVISYDAGRPTKFFVLFAVLLLSFFFISPSGGGYFGWYLVPGGVYLRLFKHRFHKGAHALMKRSECVLMLVQMTHDIYLAYVTNGDKSRATRLTRRETQLLVSGWLSDVETPEAEKLAGLIQ